MELSPLVWKDSLSPPSLSTETTGWKGTVGGSHMLPMGLPSLQPMPWMERRGGGGNLRQRVWGETHSGFPNSKKWQTVGLLAAC